MSSGRCSTWGGPAFASLILTACPGSERRAEPPTEAVAADQSDPSADPPLGGLGGWAASGDDPSTIQPPAPLGPSPRDWPALPPDPKPPTTADGLVILEVKPGAGTSTGPLRVISPVWNTLTFARYQASDGLTTFIAVREDSGKYSDVVLRGGELRTDVLGRLSGLDAHPGGCGAARDGVMLLTAPAVVPGQTQTVVSITNGHRTTRTEPKQEQAAWVVKPDGSLVEHHTELGASDECNAWVESSERFSIFGFRLAEYDGTKFQIDDGWSRGRTQMGRPFGPRYCFEFCNAAESAGTDAAVVKTLSGALGNCDATYSVLDDRLAAWCRDTGVVVRMREDGSDLEILRGVPKPAWLADGIYLTREGHVVLEFDLQMERYAVWPAGGTALGPERTLADGEVLSQSNPPVLVRGLPDPVPPADVYAVLLGHTLPFGASGSTYDYRDLRAGPKAHKARSDRAAAVLPSGDFVLAHEAAVQLSCGAYVRSPLGHEGDVIHDWVPPVLPALSSKAVHVPSTCVKLAEVHALPGDPDLLLGRTTDGMLATAWLPPPLPLPQGYDPRDGKPNEAAPVQHPRPGPGWVVHEAVDRIEGNRGEPAPGANTAISGGWQAGGGVVLTVGSQTLVLTRGGAWTLPAETRPMAVQYGPTAKLYGARGASLVVCDGLCRTLETGDRRDIVGVVPRTEREVILGFAGGATAVYRVPPTGGTETPAHAYEAVLEARLADKPRRTP